ncbi:MAG: DUF4915 domain-containing protein [Chthoniobacteraceae bacterium]
MSAGGELPPFRRSFLVTSVGAYADSGIGTGGFTAVREGEAVILDKIDSTGICRGAGLIFRFARGLRALHGYRDGRLEFTLKLPELRDIHDVVLQPDGTFLMVSTGTNEVVWVDHFGRVTKRWKGDGEDDAWHLNCVCERDGRMFLSAFGRFPSNRAWVGKCTETGMILDLETGEDVVTSLSGPHNPRWIDDQWVICNSHGRDLVIQNDAGERRHVPLGGFTRGFAHDAHYFYVGESANRKAEKPAETSSIAVLRRDTYEVVHRFTIPFPEIYELLLVSDEEAAQFVANASDTGEGSAERIRALETQVELGLKEIEFQRSLVEKWKRRKGVSQALFDLKESALRRLGLRS